MTSPETACPDCGHSIDRHFGMSELPSLCGTWVDDKKTRCSCVLRPSEVAAALIAKAHADERKLLSADGWVPPGSLEAIVAVKKVRAAKGERERIALAIEAERDRYVSGEEGAIHGWVSPAMVYTDAARIARLEFPPPNH